MPTASWSEINLHRKCPKAHDYRYRLRLQRKRPIIPMLVGKILHEMLDTYTLTKKLANYVDDPWDVLERYEKEFRKFFAEEKEEHGDIPGNCERLFEAYLRTYQDDDLTYEGTEEFVATDLATDLRFIGYIDKVAVDAHRRRWLMDHKFHKAIPDAEHRFHELQLLLYIWAWNRWNPEKPADGIVWDYVRTAPPTLPKVLKSGNGLEKRASLRCDRWTYEQEIVKHGFDKRDYTDFLTKLDNNDLMFFERVFLPAPKKPQIDSIVHDFRTTAVTIQNMKGIAPRHMSKFNCQGCEFKALCEAEVRGHDVNFVQKAHYKTREKFSGRKKEGKKKVSKKVTKKKAKSTKRKRRS